jgi:hypothetical protein
MRTYVWVILLIILAIVLVMVLIPREPSLTPVPGPAAWQEFAVPEYGFALRHPPGWLTASSTEIEPKYNVYLPLAVTAPAPPYTHHNNVSNVSVFPEGLGTEGLFGPSESVNFDVGFELRPNSRVFTLESGEPFAAYLLPVNPPATWAEAGFVWVRLGINNLESVCRRAGQVISAEQCDPLGGNDEITWVGTPSSAEWSTLLQILRTLDLEN